jgi:signal transduction histidine kinase
MRLASWVSCAISLAFCAVGAGAAATPSSAGAMRFTTAQYALTAPGAPRERAPRELRELPDATWKRVDLPHVLPRQVVTQPASREELVRDSVTAWYRIEVPREIANADASAIYLPRWHTWGSLSIYVDGELVYSSLDERALVGFNQPLLVRIPAGLDARDASIVVRVDSPRVIGSVLSSVWVGPFVELQHMFAARRWMQARIPEVSAAVMLSLGIFALCFWLLRRKETSYLFFFLLTALYFARNLRLFADDWVLDERWFGWIAVHSQGLLTVVMYLFALRFMTRRHPLAERLLLGLMLGLAILSIPWSAEQRSISVLSALTYLVQIGAALAINISIVYEAWRARSREAVLFAGAMWLGLAFGVHDWLVQISRADIEGVYLLPYGFVAMFAVFLYALVRRYIAAVTDVERANTNLQLTLAQRERELAVSYDNLRRAEEERILSQERQRLMRDMHDGVGSALMSSLVAVQRGQMPAADVAQVLSECVDALKLTIDSLEPSGDDLLVLLATLRYRLEPRLQAAGLMLEWHVSDIPKLEWMNPTSALQILRILQEVLTNVLKHAQARAIHVATEVTGAHVVVSVVDDGVGFDLAHPRPGRGLDNLRRRAEEVGGQIEITSRPGATRVKLLLPITRARAPEFLGVH